MFINNDNAILVSKEDGEYLIANGALGYIDGYFKVRELNENDGIVESYLVEYYLNNFAVFKEKTKKYYNFNNIYVTLSFAESELSVLADESIKEQDSKDVIKDLLFVPYIRLGFFVPEKEYITVGSQWDVSELLEKPFRSMLEDGLEAEGFKANIKLDGILNTGFKDAYDLSLTASVNDMEMKVDGDMLKGNLGVVSKGIFSEDEKYMKFRTTYSLTMTNKEHCDGNSVISIIRKKENCIETEMISSKIFENSGNQGKEGAK